MSLEATHLRFSLMVKEDLGILDLEKYVAGVVYPDTRYLSGIKRGLTHDLDHFAGRSDLTDFEKGWLSHIIGDKIFKEVTEDKFGDLVLFEEFEERWSVITAIKIIQDIEDFLRFDIQGILPYLDYYELHFREDERKVIEYNHIIQTMYRGKTKLTVEDCLWLWEKLGMTRGEIARLKKKLVELYGEEGLVGKISGNFEDGMELYEEKYKELMKNHVG
jgi:hypothetical protein